MHIDGFDDVFEMYDVDFELYIKDKLVNKQTMQAPKQMIMGNFIQTVQQIQQDNRPIKLKMKRPEVIWDDFENKQKTLYNEVSFSNNAMLAWEGDENK